MLLQGFECEESRVGSVAVISPSSSVQLPIDDLGVSGAKTFHPAGERRLFVVVSIKEQSLWKISLDLCKDKGCISLIFDDLAGGSLDLEFIDPIFDMQGSFLQLTIGIPLLIKGS